MDPKNSTLEINELKNWDNQRLIDELMKIRSAIRSHRDEKGNGRCWIDDQILYRLLPEAKEADFKLPCREDFLKNCSRYWQNRQPLPKLERAQNCLETSGLNDATPADIEEIARIDREIWGDWSNPLPLYRQLIEVFPGSVIVAKDIKKKLCGTIVTLYNKESLRGWILSLDVNPNNRKQGIGTSLLNSGIDLLKNCGAKTISGAVDPNNKASKKMLQKAGFAMTKLEMHYFGSEHHQEIWMLQL